MSEPKVAVMLDDKDARWIREWQAPTLDGSRPETITAEEILKARQVLAACKKAMQPQPPSPELIAWLRKRADPSADAREGSRMPQDWAKQLLDYLAYVESEIKP